MAITTHGIHTGRGTLRMDFTMTGTGMADITLGIHTVGLHIHGTMDYTLGIGADILGTGTAIPIILAEDTHTQGIISFTENVPETTHRMLAELNVQVAHM